MTRSTPFALLRGRDRSSNNAPLNSNNTTYAYRGSGDGAHHQQPYYHPVHEPLQTKTLPQTTTTTATSLPSQTVPPPTSRRARLGAWFRRMFRKYWTERNRELTPAEQERARKGEEIVVKIAAAALGLSFLMQ